MSKISVIMTAKGCANFTELALYCLKNSDISPYEIIFIEQRIGDGNRQLFEKFGARIFPAFKPGLAAAWNQGAKMARGDLLLFMHNDALISADTLRVMQETVKGNVAATGPFSV